jgi:hypothetical protein
MYICKYVYNTNAQEKKMPAWQGLWDDVHRQTYTLLNQRTQLQRVISNALEKLGSQTTSTLAIALNGIAPGGTALRTRSRVMATANTSAFDLGGRRTIETQTLINRATTTADRDALNTMFNNVYAPSPYPVDRSGNGGGGKVGSL